MAYLIWNCAIKPCINFILHNACCIYITCPVKHMITPYSTAPSFLRPSPAMLQWVVQKKPIAKPLSRFDFRFYDLQSKWPLLWTYNMKQNMTYDTDFTYPLYWYDVKSTARFYINTWNFWSTRYNLAAFVVSMQLKSNGECLSSPEIDRYQC